MGRRRPTRPAAGSSPMPCLPSGQRNPDRQAALAEGLASGLAPVGASPRRQGEAQPLGRSRRGRFAGHALPQPCKCSGASRRGPRTRPLSVYVGTPEPDAVLRKKRGCPRRTPAAAPGNQSAQRLLYPKPPNTSRSSKTIIRTQAQVGIALHLLLRASRRVARSTTEPDQTPRGPSGGFEISSTISPTDFSLASRATSACETTPTSRFSSSTTGSRRTWLAAMIWSASERS